MFYHGSIYSDLHFSPLFRLNANEPMLETAPYVVDTALPATHVAPLTMLAVPLYTPPATRYISPGGGVFSSFFSGSTGPSTAVSSCGSQENIFSL